VTVNFKRIFPVCAIAAMLVLIEFVANADRAYADESLDKILATAMEKNPDIVTAKAKVTLAQAELNATRLQVARQIISHWYALEKQRYIVNREKEANKNIAGSVSLTEIQENEAKLHQLEAELHYLCGGGEIAGIKQDTVIGISIKTDVTQTAKPLQIPSGPVAEKYTKEFFAQSTHLEFVEQPLQTIIDYLKDYHKFGFFLDKNALAEAGISSDMPISLDIKGVSLAAAMQLFEDQYQGQGLQFVVRDYGILLTTIEQAKAQGYYPVLEYAKLVGKEKSPAPEVYTPRLQPLRQPSRTEATKSEQDPFQK